jgi:adenosylcobinamide-GDP ribazoletransferase
VTVDGLRVATAFLTRVPLARPGDTPRLLARAVPWFPVVGAGLGLAIAATYAAAGTVLPALAAAAIAVGAGIAVTGAFHEDGLADFADALGGESREDALRIMKDPTHGTFGVVAIGLSLLIRIAALAGLDGWAALGVLPAAHALARAAALMLLGVLRPATGSGLGADYAAWIRGSTLAGAAGAGIVVAAIGLRWWAGAAVVAVSIGVLVVGALAWRRVGGLTGDVLGAAEQVGEVVVLLVGVAALA